ncbi:MAG TPA: molybdopterin cofactor-binding domain-containing protein [Acidobacteriaceae bacterium]|jgi:isoquinoline 1-oxidoreductase beta subunit
MKINVEPPRETHLKLSRRAFLASSAAVAGTGALVIGFRLYRPFHVPHSAGDPFDSWIRIYPDNRVELVLAKSEMGQGVFTALPMVLAEEAELDWSRVRVVQSEESTGTGGSGSVRESYLPLRQAGAQLREVMISAAAGRWAIPREECFARSGSVTHRTSGRVLSYGGLVEQARRLPLPDAKTVRLKTRGEFNLLGRPLPHLDIPDKTTGRARFGIDVRPAGLVFATVAQSPRVGGTLIDFDRSPALQVPGVLDVFEIRSREGIRQVAVVGRTTWAAMRGRDALKVRWNPGPHAGESSEAMTASMRAAFDKPPEWTWPTAHISATPAGPVKQIESVYEYPFLAHAPIEPMNTTIHVQEGRCEVWAPTQDGHGVRKTVAQELGMPESNVRVHVTFVGGGFGSRFNKAYTVQAALIARQMKLPVQLVWTREDTIAYDEFRQCGGQKLRGSIDSKGNVLSWSCHIVDTSITGPCGMPPQAWEAPDLETFLYPIPNLHYTYSQIQSAIRRGAWRSVSESFNGFVLESFIDELAHAARIDPYLFRRRLLASDAPPPQAIGQNGAAAPTPKQQQAEALLAVLDQVAERAQWRSPLAKGRGRGIACWRAYTSYIAQVAEITSTKDRFHIDRIVSVVDCGQVLNPNGVKAQIEGGCTMGLSAALREAVTIQNGVAQEQNFNSYQLLRMPDTPTFETYLVDSGREPGGIGELGITLAAPIVGNAVFAATGKRLKRLPFQLDEASL